MRLTSSFIGNGANKDEEKKKEDQRPMTDAEFKAWLIQTGDSECAPFMSTPPIPTLSPYKREK